MLFFKDDPKFNMTVKEWFRKYQPLQLYIILTITLVFFVIELIVSHVTHAITLLMNSYQMLCNILALSGYIATVKFQSKDQNFVGSQTTTSAGGGDKKLEVTEHKLKNTFGWARIDVVSMLMCCVFSYSLCFSVLVEALQTLVHIDHLHEIHNPIVVLGMGIAGLILNVLCYLLIGGYTFHQACFLYVTEEGEVVLNKVTSSQMIRQGDRRLSRTRVDINAPSKKRQNLLETLRDILGCLLVIVCSVWVYYSSEWLVKFIDPGIAILHAVSMMLLSFPYMKESCFILLQTMPGSTNIDSLKIDLVQHFPDIVNIHDFHVWQLTTNKVISTVHIIFHNPTVYKRIIGDIKQHFLTNGITQVTIQPEFFNPSSVDVDKIIPTSFIKCLMACKASCGACLCCPEHEDVETSYRLKDVTHSSQETLPEEPEVTVEADAESQHSSPQSDNSQEENDLLKQEEKMTVSAREIVRECNQDLENVS